MMKAPIEFRQSILEHLQAFPYVLLDPIAAKEEHAAFNILFQKDTLKQFLPVVKQLTGLHNINISSTFSTSQAILNFKGNVEMMIQFIHKFTHRSIIYFDESEILSRRVRVAEGYYIPCVEHLFEQKVIQSFLDMKGISKTAFQYFTEFHILVQEDLLDYFNAKYGTTFSSLYQLTDYDDRQRVQIIKKLKALPANGFVKSIQHTFLGFIKQARII